LPEPAAESSRSFSRTTSVAVLAIMIIAGAVRAGGLFNDLWFDEIWTIGRIQKFTSLGWIFTRFLHDNKHPLNTEWMYLVMGSDVAWLYRLPAWIAGLVSVWIAAQIALLQFRYLRADASPDVAQAAAIIIAVLVGSSYTLTVYFSEARG